MNWIKENKSLAAVFGVMIVGALGLGIWVFSAYSGYTTKREEWSNVISKLQSLESEKLYPNAENAAEKEKLVTDYSQQVDLLRTALLDPAVQAPVKALSETEFQARLKERVNSVRAAASDKMTLPGDFALGFEQYTGSLPRSAEVAAELGVHLDVMEKLVSVFIDSGIKSLDSFERAELPNEKAAPPPPKEEPANNRRRRPAADAGSSKQLISEAAAAEPVMDRYTVKAYLTTDQAPFQAVINTLSDPAKMPHFVVVRLLRVENEQAEGPVKAEVRGAVRPQSSEDASTEGFSESAGAPAGADAVRTIAAAKPMPIDAVTIMGEEKLKVYLEIDYIRFRPAVAEASEDKNTTARATP